MASVLHEKMTLTSVRRAAARNVNLTEIYVNEVSKVVSFRDAKNACRINVYYTTGTVGTCINNPFIGKTQMFRRNVTMSVLAKLFENPRHRTSTGYFGKRIQRFVNYYESDDDESDGEYFYVVADSDDEEELGESSVPNEEVALRMQLLLLEPQVQLIKDRLSELEQARKQEEEKRLAAAQVLAAAEKKRVEDIQRKATEAAAAKAEAERQEKLREKQQKEQLQAKQLAADESRRINLRGGGYDYSLRFHDTFPDSMKNVKCVTVSGGGFAAVFDNGTCTWHGIPEIVSTILNRQHNANIAYIALGQCGQYYIRKTNGKVFMNGHSSFEEVMNQLAPVGPKYIAFGNWENFFVAFENGQRCVSRSLQHHLPNSIFEMLMSPSLRPIHVYLGDTINYGSGNVPYYIALDANRRWYDHLPQSVTNWLEHKQKPSNKVKQLLVGDNSCFFVRYS